MSKIDTDAPVMYSIL